MVSGSLPYSHGSNAPDSGSSPFDRAPCIGRQGVRESIERISPADVARLASGVFSSDDRELVGIRSGITRRFSASRSGRNRDWAGEISGNRREEVIRLLLMVFIIMVD